MTNFKQWTNLCQSHSHHSHHSHHSSLSPRQQIMTTQIPMSSSSPKSRRSPAPTPPPTSSYLSYPVSHVVSALYRRLTDTSPHPAPAQSPSQPPNPTTPPLSMSNGAYTQPRRTASPFQPPPLSPLALTGFDPATAPSAQILSRALAEEIRLLVPPRLQLADTWSLVYSLEQDGVSLATLYNKCASADLPRSSSFVLVIRDAAGGVRFVFLFSTWSFLFLCPSLSIASFPPPPPLFSLLPNR